MPTLLYIHGFLSSPQSAKARLTQEWLREYRPDWHYECPALSSYPVQARATLENTCARLGCNDAVYLIGSSLGGFWATYLAERYGFPAVLVNPAVHPQRRFGELVGQTLKNYHTAETYRLTQADLDELEACAPQSLRNTDLYWLMVQTGDEVLDYRLAVEFYQGCRQTVERGGNHTFEGFENWLAEIADFFASFVQTPTTP
jgi:predicted esterase YcpF (UPF0227 family)